MLRLIPVSVILAHAGIYGLCKTPLSLDSRLRGNDEAYALNDGSYVLNDDSYVLNDDSYILNGRS